MAECTMELWAINGGIADGTSEVRRLVIARTLVGMPMR